MSGAAWAALLPAAAVGTERQRGPWPLGADNIGTLARQAADAADTPATGLLRAAAVLAVCGLAGAQGASWDQPAPPAAPDDSRPALEAGAAWDALAWLLQHGPLRLQIQALLQLAQAGRRLPPQLLPQALELGRRAIVLRAPLLEVLGDRGLWLAAQHDDWRYAAGVSEADTGDATWTDGTLEQRRIWLARARQADAAAARERLQPALPELPARERAELVAVLAVGLGPADAELLDQLRTDRAREVRQGALNLLLSLPDAAHPQRAMARVAPLLTLERGLLRKRWQIDAPTEAGRDWKADQVDAARPKQHALGERAWWLYQLVRQVPLGWWSRHMDLTPAELLAWAADTDWRDALLRGWIDVLFAAPDAAWSHALLDRWPDGLTEDPARVLALLPPAQCDRHLLRGPLSRQPAATRIELALNACSPGQTMSAELSTELSRELQAQARDGALNTDYRLRGLLPDFASAVHADAFAALAALPRRADETPSCADALLTLEHIVSARRALLTTIPTRTP